MKTIVFAIVVAGSLLIAASDVRAMAWFNHSATDGGSENSPNVRVPEPSTLYAVGAGIGLLGGAGWYIRRRK